MKVQLIESVTLRSEPLPAGAVIDTDEITAGQLVASGQAETAPAEDAAPAKTTKQSKE